jgi:N-acylneuraminate cytidylyltransferase
MRILALITARGGSKRVPGKNIRLLGGKPLIVWSIETAKDIAEICDILVSTEDPAIAEVSVKSGALVPWLRPIELATDTANSVDVALHALDWYEAEKGAVDGLLLLQPTSPFRTKETVRKGIELFMRNSQKPVLGVSPAPAHPMWTLKPDGDQLVPYFEDHGFGRRSQDLPDAYAANGCFYLVSPEQLRASKSFVGVAVQPLLIDTWREAIDIDTEEDWDLAERILSGDRDRRSTWPHIGFNAEGGLSPSTESYLSENEAAFSVERHTQVHPGNPRKVEIATLRGIAKWKVENAVLGTARYLSDLILGWDEIKRLSALKGSKQGKKAIVIGNGPSQGLISPEALGKFCQAGNDVYAVNFWHKNIELATVPPQYLLISDPATLGDPTASGWNGELVVNANQGLLEYLLEHKDITLLTPVGRTKQLRAILGENRVLGFIDTEMRWLTANIDPRLPRGYLSMTLFKALALAIHMGYRRIYIVGMDNTYPRDIFCNEENRIFNYERHAGTDDYLVDVTSVVPSMDVWAQDIFQLFHDLRRCFSGCQVLNLDCYSLTDVFPKVSNLSQIDELLTGPE